MVRPPREKKLPVVLSAGQVRRILGCIHRQRYRVCLSTIYACGLRVQEGVHLQVRDIDSERMVVHVRHAKGAKDRYVPLPESTLKMLRQYWCTHRHTVWLFPARTRASVPPSTAGTPMSVSGVQKAFKAALQESGVQKSATVHTLRHSYGRPFGRLVNISLDMARHQRRVSSPWRPRVPSCSGPVSFQGT